MNWSNILITTFESLYMYYMYNIFKTKYSIHHPLEWIIGNSKYNVIKHPIDTGLYESKICVLGKLVSILLILWIWFRFLLRKFVKNNFVQKINLFIFIIVALCSLLMNINAFIYYIPIYVYEIFLNKNFIS